MLWDQSLFRIGSQSSPRTADLNQDGVLDIVIGAGLAETGHTDQGVLALNGMDGSILWQVEANAMVSGSATFLDINQDGIEDVIIGGRNRVLKALNGSNGQLLWQYEYAYEDDPILQYARYNFYNCSLIPDQNGDGLQDLLTVNGGNWDAAPNTEKGRFPGILMILDSQSGEVIAADSMPDGKESYMSPVIFQQPANETYSIIIGTGGETISGHLYEIELETFLKQGLSSARLLAKEKGHGFIAPPVIVDLNGDGWLDIVPISHAGSIVAIHGGTKEYIWQHRFKGIESSNSLAVGYFSGDDSPDLFAYACKGVWPAYEGARQLMIEGESGEILWQDSLGCGSLAAAVSYDLNGDRQDEVILSLNEFDCSMGYVLDRPDLARVSNRLAYIDFKTNRVETIDKTAEFKNVFSTPWIGDLDEDTYLDIVYPQYLNQDNLILFLGMRMKRVSTNIRMNADPVWGAYMGSNGDGVFQELPR